MADPVNYLVMPIVPHDRAATVIGARIDADTQCPPWPGVIIPAVEIRVAPMAVTIAGAVAFGINKTFGDMAALPDHDLLSLDIGGELEAVTRCRRRRRLGCRDREGLAGIDAGYPDSAGRQSHHCGDRHFSQHLSPPELHPVAVTTCSACPGS